jgi:hypothetical protein
MADRLAKDIRQIGRWVLYPAFASQTAAAQLIVLLPTPPLPLKKTNLTAFLSGITQF